MLKTEMLTDATACYSVSEVFRTETAFPFWKAMDKRCDNTNMLFL